MKNILIQIFILIPFFGYSQNIETPKIDWQSITESENIYVDLLNIEDRNSIIVQIGYSSYWTKGLNAEFIVFQNDGKVKRFVVYTSNSIELKTKVKRKRISKKKYYHYWEYLKKSIDEGFLEIDKSKLNITHKKSNDEEFGQSMSISDGTSYQFEICKGRTTFHIIVTHL